MDDFWETFINSLFTSFLQPQPISKTRNTVGLEKTPALISTNKQIWVDGWTDGWMQNALFAFPIPLYKALHVIGGLKTPAEQKCFIFHKVPASLKVGGRRTEGECTQIGIYRYSVYFY